MVLSIISAESNINSVSLLTNKGSIYATTLSLISLQNSSLAEIIIDRVIDLLQIALDQGWHNSVLYKQNL